jgi:CBS domain-containing membrane protein
MLRPREAGVPCRGGDTSYGPGRVTFTSGDPFEPEQMRSQGIRNGFRKWRPSRESRLMLGLWPLAAGFASIALLGCLAIVTEQPFVFPSLGPTAFLIFSRPGVRDASPRNTILGHLIGALCGYLALVLFGLTNAGPAVIVGFTAARTGAAALSLGLTAGLMIWLGVSHPPAGATTLIISLGVMAKPEQVAVLMVGVVLLVGLGLIANRLAGFTYPLWAQPAGAPPGPAPSAGDVPSRSG